MVGPKLIVEPDYNDIILIINTLIDNISLNDKISTRHDVALKDLTLGIFKHIPILNKNNISYIKILSCLILCWIPSCNV